MSKCHVLYHIRKEQWWEEILISCRHYIKTQHSSTNTICMKMSTMCYNIALASSIAQKKVSLEFLDLCRTFFELAFSATMEPVNLARKSYCHAKLYFRLEEYEVRANLTRNVDK
jgi:hypothetical protein